jgi:hypothetical protein
MTLIAEIHLTWEHRYNGLRHLPGPGGVGQAMSPKVLLVDDEADLLAGGERVLRPFGCCGLTATTDPRRSPSSTGTARISWSATCGCLALMAWLSWVTSAPVYRPSQ